MLFCVRIKKACFFCVFFKAGANGKKQVAVKKIFKTGKYFCKIVDKPYKRCYNEYTHRGYIKRY